MPAFIVKKRSRFPPSFRDEFPNADLAWEDKGRKWDEKCQQAFEQIKECLMNPPVFVLVPTRPGKPLLLYLSVIEAAMGCMLAQMDDEGIERAVYYLS